MPMLRVCYQLFNPVGGLGSSLIHVPTAYSHPLIVKRFVFDMAKSPQSNKKWVHKYSCLLSCTEEVEYRSSMAISTLNAPTRFSLDMTHHSPFSALYDQNMTCVRLNLAWGYFGLFVIDNTCSPLGNPCNSTQFSPFDDSFLSQTILLSTG